MNSQRIIVVLGLAIAAAAATGADVPTIKATGAIDAVTIYRGQALVSRAVAIDLPAGPAALVVTDLPPQIVADSLYASADGDVQIRAVRYGTQAVKEEPREEVRQLDEQIEKLSADLRENQALQKLQAQKESYLAGLEQFSAEKVKDELAKGTLKVDAITGLADFLFGQRAAVTKELLRLAEQQRALQEKLTLLQRKRAELTQRSSRTAREAVVFLDKRARGKANVRLEYLVQGATWSPAYNLRCAGQGQQVSLEYNALVQQMSGEDWTGVKVTLSTASPAMVAESPILMPLWVTLTPHRPPQPGAPRLTLYEGQSKFAAEQRVALARRRGGASNLEQSWDVNEWANRLQFVDLTARRDLLLAGKELAVGEEALSVNYELPGAISIPSRSDQQMIQLATLKLAGEFYNLAIPLLTPFVYQHADIVNTSETALLAGPVSSYLNGQFMGIGRIPMVAKGQQFTVGFGVDSQLRAARELADKIERIQGGNREMTFRYRLLIDNYKEKLVKVRVLDRLPDPKGADIRITLGELKDPLSEEKVYLRTLRKAGILRWEIEVPAKASGATARIIDYEYKVEFDRNMDIGEPTATEIERQNREFKVQLEASQRMR